METALFALLVLVVLYAAVHWPAWCVGLVASLAVCIRPEGWLLLVLVLVVLAWNAMRQHSLFTWLWGWCFPFLLGFLPLGIAYVSFSLWAGGQLLPTTFTAKSAEFYQQYDGLTTLLVWLPQWLFLFLLSSPILVALTLLAWMRPRPTVAPTVSPLLLRRLLWCWSVTLIAPYVGRVDPGYHHSRYLLPALPSLLILAAVRATPVLLSPKRRMLAQFGSLILVVVCVISLARTPSILHNDVYAINCAEVDMGRWLADNTPPGAIIAAHDVGALGYFSHRHIIDIAGLVDPELIPLLHQPAALVALLKAQHVAYVAISQYWWPPPVMQELGTQVVYRACGVGVYRVYQTGW